MQCSEVYNAVKAEFGEDFAEEMRKEAQAEGVTKEMCDHGMPIADIMHEFDMVEAKHVADGGKMAPKEF